MTSLTFVSVSGILTFGIPMALAVWELLTIRPTPRDGDWPPPEEPKAPAPKPLPACLRPSSFPAPVIRQVRVLEDA